MCMRTGMNRIEGGEALDMGQRNGGGDHCGEQTRN